MGRRKPFPAAAKHAGVFGDERVVVGVDDLVLLPSVSETSILENLKMRHAADVIYSYIGHVLVVVNPYKWLDIYGEDSMHAYTHKARIDVPPHVFATAEETYRTMLSEEDNQCVIISGESGAGKTEASKQIQNYIAGVSGSGAGVDKVKRTFLESNPLLEAFGNAKTLRNNNSSRFGKYFELLFDSAGRPQGGKVTNYLLEKSRVVKPGKGERNFHIFYQVLAGLPAAAKQKLYLDRGGPDSFHYLKVSGCYDVDDVNDAQEFDETMAAMQHVGIKRKQIELVIQTLAAVLHIGNVHFQPETVGDAEGSSVRDRESLQIACGLLGLDAARVEHALCYKLLQTMAPGGKIESYEVPQNTSQAKAQRDSIAKAVYDRLFDFLVERVNHALDIEKKAEKHGEILEIDDMTTIGILDIYGFEIFDKNGFEQFCINYVNEKLQQIFIELTLKSEQEEYAREGIAWSPIPFFNNKVVCDLIEARRPTPGIFLILDDTVKTMHSRQGESVDANFLEKVAGIHGSHPHFSKRGKTFEIKHYAGDVQYNIDGFGDSNKDFLSKDIALIISETSNKLMRYIFPEEIDLNDKRMANTAGYKIRTQCEALVTALMDCTPHYVRCIKSNDQKQPNKMDDRRVIHQIKYLGLLENVKVRRAGYAYRGDYGRFVDRFRLLSKETYPEFRGSDKKGTQAVLRAAVKSLPQLENEVQLGKTMVFIQTPETFFELEKLREKKLGSFVMRIQKAWKKYYGRRHLLQLSHDITKLYASNNKQRQRVSIYRPFDGDYLRDSTIRDAVMGIIQHYGDSEKIVFLDEIQKACPIAGVSPDGSPIALAGRILIITDQYLYLMEKPIEEITMSTMADPYFVLKVIGLMSTEMPEDQLLLSEKKTEIAVTLVDAIRSLANVATPINFSDSIRLRRAASVGLSKTPPQQIQFVSSGHDRITGDANSVQLHVAPGVPDEYIRKRRKREKARRKKLERQREEELAMRAQRQEQRSREREAERLRRVAEKKAKKQAEKEARKHALTSRKSAKASMESVRKFGESVQSSPANGGIGGANSELAAILARRRGA
ncbi:myosin-like protein [Phytophthora cinnamomi]|uniref:myosin-like protein n=1 Tax=Phytophthora cinnamomi TaxID=4785 RepID=UPI00355994F3|nr:myosin-like protein [Phytophthora cinnamomi]